MKGKHTLTKWTDKERQIIVHHVGALGETTSRFASKLPGRTNYAINSKIKAMGLRLPKIIRKTPFNLRVSEEEKYMIFERSEALGMSQNEFVCEAILKMVESTSKEKP